MQPVFFSNVSCRKFATLALKGLRLLLKPDPGLTLTQGASEGKLRRKTQDYTDKHTRRADETQVWTIEAG